MLAVDGVLAVSLSCPLANAVDGVGKALIAPIAAYVIAFPIIMVFGGFGRGQISSLIGTLGLYFGSRTKLIVFGIFALCGAAGGGLIAAANSWSSGCIP
ncbi:hypothetical protein DMB66_49740 [Actinoplanes sp. ATCC 53533]|uniref:hypothetical protein n=1 Tax=Actinoplanes sp. ATCC 53533 TaxID=1288362 RepID=UPI000F7B2634|nr:hypothetical protein [Actinoplanes sp. ATCC 53533]RSM46254.1 hypothetical protein DMB66_49740 [Actinoplanes sp. ATCC 53533]